MIYFHERYLQFGLVSLSWLAKGSHLLNTIKKQKLIAGTMNHLSCKVINQHVKLQRFLGFVISRVASIFINSILLSPNAIIVPRVCLSWYQVRVHINILNVVVLFSSSYFTLFPSVANFSGIRTFRVLRTLRTISAFKGI